MLRVALTALGLTHAEQDVTLDGDRPGRAYAHREGEMAEGPTESDDDEAASDDDEAADKKEPGFNDWLNKALHETYDPVAKEPLPSDFDALISRLEKLPPQA